MFVCSRNVLRVCLHSLLNSILYHSQRALCHSKSSRSVKSLLPLPTSHCGCIVRYCGGNTAKDTSQGWSGCGMGASSCFISVKGHTGCCDIEHHIIEHLKSTSENAGSCYSFNVKKMNVVWNVGTTSYAKEL
jgi:hypothetical protein